nr:hypothetical protein CPGR_04200 [Mycolicibacterium malmesburyense]
MPLTARMPPSPSNRRARRSASSPVVAAPPRSRNVNVGPQSGQQTGWAWNLRSAGSWYSRAQASHMSKAAMVVA